MLLPMITERRRLANQRGFTHLSPSISEMAERSSARRQLRPWTAPVVPAGVSAAEGALIHHSSLVETAKGIVHLHGLDLKRVPCTDLKVVLASNLASSE